jgi:hypothetical protein
VQQVAECLIGKLLKGLHRLAREQIEPVPSLLIEPHELAPGLCRLLGHEEPPVAQSTDANITIMPARTYLVFGDIEGKLDTLRVECTKCPRKGRYSVHKLIEKYGRKANMMKWKEQLNADCPRRDAHGLHERCTLVCSDLPKVL